MLSKREVGVLLMGIGGVSMLVVYILIISLRKTKSRSKLVESIVDNDIESDYQTNPMYE
tara:strand:+ start:1028 stop:1204 length:177 start_codon:yes stop_codon:yes gene_type:complete